MARKNNRFTQSQGRRTSEQMRSSTIGAHVERNADSAARSKLKLSSQRKNERANRGVIHTVTPDTYSRESASSYARRIRRQGSVVQAARINRAKGIAIGVLVVIVAVAAAIAVGWFTYTSSISSKFALSDDAAKAALTAPSDASSPYYVLVEGEFDDGVNDYEGPGLLMLVRVDAADSQVSIVDIPSSLETTLSDGKTHTLPYAQVLGGDAGLISAVESFSGVSISHLFKVDSNGFQSLVDSVGGITVDVPQEVDDPDAGDVYIPAGTQTLDGAEALELCRANNYTDPIEVQSTNQLNVLTALFEKVADTPSSDVNGLLDSIGSSFKTDMSLDDLHGLFDAFGSDSTVHTGHVPGIQQVETDGTYFIVSSSAWSNMMSVVDSGGDPSSQNAVVSLDPSQVSITVKNGAAVNGAATQLKSLLEGKGYTVGDVGSTDTAAYSETLVVYLDSTYEGAAEDVVNAMGVGRTVDGSAYYSFDTDLEVIIGSDWKPIS